MKKMEKSELDGFVSKLKNEQKRRYKYPCSYPLCENVFTVNQSVRTKHFFCLSRKDPKTEAIWKENLGLKKTDKTANLYVCQDHFEDKCFTSTLKTRLCKFAVPMKVGEPKPSSNDKDYINLENVEDNGADNVPTNIATSEGSFQQFLQNTSVNVEDNGADNISTNIATSEGGFQQFLQNTSKMSPNEHSNCDNNYLNTENNVLSHTFTDNDEKTQTKISAKDKRVYTMYVSHKSKPDRNKVVQLGEADLRNLHDIICENMTKLHNQIDYASDSSFSFVQKHYIGNHFNMLESYLDYLPEQYIKSVIHLKHHVIVRKFSTDELIFSLTIYTKNPKLYRYLQYYFNFPPNNLLKSTLNKLTFDTDINYEIFNNLKYIVSKMKSKLERNCTLMFGELKLQTGVISDPCREEKIGFEDFGQLGKTQIKATNVLVFMARGITKNWKQIIAYYFTSQDTPIETYKEIIKNVITHLDEINLSVKAIVCEQSIINERIISSLNLGNPSSEYNYLIVNNKEIMIIYDVLNLIIATRNCMFNCDIVFDENKTAKFSYLKAAFHLDRKRLFPVLRSLKEKHFLSDNAYKKNSISPVSKQFSHKMASAIENCVKISDSLQNFPQEAIETARFVKLMDNLLDSVNTPRNIVEGKRFSVPLSMKSSHIKFWDKFLDNVKKWKFTDRTGKLVGEQQSFVEGWQISINSFKNLWKILLEEDYSLTHLDLRVFNLDPLRNLFKSFKHYGNFEEDPMCYQIENILKVTLLNDSKRYKCVDRFDCEPDDCYLLDNLNSFI